VHAGTGHVHLFGDHRDDRVVRVAELGLEVVQDLQEGARSSR